MTADQADRLRRNYVARVTRTAASVFRDELARVVRQGEAGVIPGPWQAWIERTYRTVGQPFAESTLAALGVKAEPLDVYRQLLQTWLENEAAQRVVGILETTRQIIRQQLAEGVAAGESTDQLATRLRTLYRSWYSNRAEVIARTEVVSASNLASLNAARATNLRLNKRWVATRDARTRSRHASAHGQIRPLDEPFAVGGQRLMYPGDTSLGATADNVIQCRCTQTFQRAKPND